MPSVLLAKGPHCFCHNLKHLNPFTSSVTCTLHNYISRILFSKLCLQRYGYNYHIGFYTREIYACYVLAIDIMVLYCYMYYYINYLKVYMVYLKVYIVLLALLTIGLHCFCYNLKHLIPFTSNVNCTLHNHISIILASKAMPLVVWT